MELFTPDFGLIFWMFVAFAILFFLLWKFAWPMILKTVDHRADLIDKGVSMRTKPRSNSRMPSSNPMPTWLRPAVSRPTFCAKPTR